MLQLDKRAVSAMDGRQALPDLRTEPHGGEVTKTRRHFPKNGISKARAKAAVKQALALTLRGRGWTYEEIAKEVPYASAGGAHKAVRTGLRATLKEPADDVRELELGRLDKLLRAQWDKAMAGDLGAVQAVLRIMDRRATYLGLDAPQKVDIEAHIRQVAEEEGMDPDEAVRIADDVIRENRW